MLRRIEARIFGRGLGNDFISSIKELAGRFPIKGGVSTRPDGSIRIIAEGEEAELGEFISKVRRGTLFSAIESFDVVWKEVEEKTDRFFVLSC